MYRYWLIIAQIVLESFPISSSAHTILLQRILQQMDNGVVHADGLHAVFEHATLFESDVLAHWAHGPTLFVVALFFFHSWFFLLCHIKKCWRIIAKIIAFTALADLVTVLFFVLFHAFGTEWFPIGVGLCITSAALFSLAYIPKKQPAIWTWRTALLLGLVQGCALLPGISRLAATYVAARWLNFVPRKAVEISLLIQWPLIFVAWCNSVRILVNRGLLLYSLNPTMLLAMVGAAVVAFYSLCFVYYCLSTRRERWFAWYLIIPIGVWIWLSLTSYTF